MFSRTYYFSLPDHDGVVVVSLIMFIVINTICAVFFVGGVLTEMEGVLWQWEYIGTGKQSWLSLINCRIWRGTEKNKEQDEE